MRDDAWYDAPIVETEAIRFLIARVEASLQKPFRVLLTGEKGTGKGTVVRAGLPQGDDSAFLVIEGIPDVLGVPYAPLARAFHEFLTKYGRSKKHGRLALEISFELARLVPILGQFRQSIIAVAEKVSKNSPAPVTNHLDVLHQTKNVIRKLSKRDPVVLVFRGIDAYDPSTLSILLSLVADDELPCSYVLEHLVKAALESRRRLAQRDAATRFRDAAALQALVDPAKQVEAQGFSLEAGVSLYLAGQYEGAIDTLRDLAIVAVDVHAKAAALLYQGLAEYMGSTYENAQATLEHLLKQHGDVVTGSMLCTARLTLASVLYHRGEWDAARKHYRKVFALTDGGEPCRLDALKRINMFYVTELALPMLQRELGLLDASKNPDLFWEINHNLGCNHLMMNQLVEAETAFRASLRHFESVGSHKAAYPHNNLAIVNLLRGDFVRARHHIDQVREAPISEFDRASAECHRGIILALEKKTGEAINAMEAAARIASQEPILQEVTNYNLAWILSLQGDAAGALLRLGRDLPHGNGPWQDYKIAQRQRLAQRLLGTAPLPGALQGKQLTKLETTGRKDAWIYKELDFEFSEVWFWE